MSIGTTIKRLRRERSLTQDQLADMLGVSACAVSQWECDRTAPDIGQIPSLACIFEVSSDVILEIDIAKSKRLSEIAGFVEKCDRLHGKGQNEDRLALCRDMQRKYPNDEEVLYQLMRALRCVRSEECAGEIIELGERLLSSDDPEKRHGAIRCLCFTHYELGDQAAAISYARMVPPNEDLLLHVLRGDELLLHCQQYFAQVCRQMSLYVNSMTYLTDGYSAEERHRICKTVYDVFHLIYDRRDFGREAEDRLGRLCFRMAQDSALLGEGDRAIAELEEMLRHFDKMTDFEHIDHTSLLLNRLSADAEDEKRKDEISIYSTFAHYLECRMECFADIADDPRFLRIREELSTKAEG